MRATYSQIKQLAKDRFHDRIGDGILIVIVPSLIVLVLNLIVQQILGFFEPKLFFIVTSIISLLFTTAAGYIVIKLILPFLRGEDGVKFENFFKFDKNLIPYAILRILIVLIYLAPVISLLPIYLEIQTNPILASDTQALQDYLESSGALVEMSNAMPLWGLVSLIFSLIMVRFSFTNYIIVDQKLGLLASLKKSWEITRGNYFRVLFFPLSFILWIFLGIITCGIGFLYVTPYMACSLGHMYFVLMEENGEGVSNFDPDSLKYDEKVISKDFEDPLNEYYN